VRFAQITREKDENKLDPGALPFWPLIFIGQSNLIDCVRDEGVKDGCRSEEVLEGR
jgi:hypothetical protein